MCKYCKENEDLKPEEVIENVLNRNRFEKIHGKTRIPWGSYTLGKLGISKEEGLGIEFTNLYPDIIIPCGNTDKI